MNDKFTIRDFFVYFLSGVVVLLFVFASYYEDVSNYIVENKYDIKGYSSLLMFFSIPIAYFLGQILHGIDSMLYFTATASRKLKPKKRKFYNVAWLIIYLLNGHRISGRLFLEGKQAEDFWKDCAKLQVEKNFSSCEYWYVMNDLFKGLCLASFIFFLVSIYEGTWGLALIYLFIALIFWFRSVFFAVNFIATVRRTMIYSKASKE